LKDGSALVLLDGLDEVKNLSMRHTVVERVVSYFTAHKSNGNKFVLTSRVVGYRDVRPAAEGLVEATLVDFDDQEIADFAKSGRPFLKTRRKEAVLPQDLMQLGKARNWLKPSNAVKACAGWRPTTSCCPFWR